MEKIVWIIIAGAEGAVIIALAVLLFLQKRKGKHRKKRLIRERAMKEDVDYENIFKSSFSGEDLFRNLKIKCHPDRFAGDEEKTAKALAIFQSVSKNRYNFKKLEELKEIAIKELNIKL